eukprot:8352456-Heterocapsa_arctica.AAC.1
MEVVASTVWPTYDLCAVPAKSQKFRVDMANLTVPWRRRQFEDLMWASSPPSVLTYTVDEHLEHFLEYVKAAAGRSFGAPAPVPRQPW